MEHVTGRPPRRVIKARRPGPETFCNVLLLREGRHVALLVHALDDLRVEFDDAALAALIDALTELRTL